MRSIFDQEANAADAEEARRHFARGAEAGRRWAEELRGVNPYPLVIDAFVADIVASSAIEGERLDSQQVRAAIVRRLSSSEAERAIGEAAELVKPTK
jgi:hypothetical protein